MLNLAYYHAVLLVQRPFLLSNFASLTHVVDTRLGRALEGSGIDVRGNVQSCLDAAMGIVRVVDEMNGGMLFRAFWFTQYYAFCAVVVLYVYRIQQGMLEPGKCEGYFAAGQRCQAVLSSISGNDCLSQRYCLVLEELRMEAAKHQYGKAGVALDGGAAAGGVNSPDASSGLGTSANLGVPASTPQIDPSSPGLAGGSYYGTNIPPMPESAVFNTSFLPTSSIMADLTSWGQFDSLVTAGIGLGLDGGYQGDGILGFGL